MNETIKMFLEENGYQCTCNGPLFFKYSKINLNSVFRFEIDFDGAFELWMGGEQIVKCNKSLDENTVILLLSSCGAGSLSFLTKSLTA